MVLLISEADCPFFLAYWWQHKRCLQLHMATQVSNMMIGAPSVLDLVQLCAEGHFIVFSLISNHFSPFISNRKNCPDRIYCLCKLCSRRSYLFLNGFPELIQPNNNDHYWIIWYDPRHYEFPQKLILANKIIRNIFMYAPQQKYNGCVLGGIKQRNHWWQKLSLVKLICINSLFLKSLHHEYFFIAPLMFHLDLCVTEIPFLLSWPLY